MRPSVRRSAAALNMAIGAPADTPMLGRPRSQRKAQRHPLEDQQRRGELQHGEHHQEREQLAEGRLGAASRATQACRTTIAASRAATRPRRAPRINDRHRPMQRDVVIGIADRRRDGDDLAVGIAPRPRRLQPQTLAWSASVSCITMSRTLRRRRTTRRQSRQSLRRRRRPRMSRRHRPRNCHRHPSRRRLVRRGQPIQAPQDHPRADP